MKAPLLMIGLLLCSAVTVAQERSAPATSVAAAPSAPKHTCVKPVMPEKFTSGAQQDAFQAEVETFRTCLMDYRNRMQRIAQAHVEAGNAAANEFNAYIKELNAATDKANAAAAEAAKAAEKK